MSQNTLIQFGERENREAVTLIALARSEDLAESGDITSNAVIPAHAIATANLVARASGIIAGLPVLQLLLHDFRLGDHSRILCSDGDAIQHGTLIAQIAGSLRSLLAFERVALNFLQRLSGIATLTARFVAEVAGTNAVILDTRKTTPGWRSLEKYAVRCGGGQNHRHGLHDAVLIKDNHLAWLQYATPQRDQDAIAHSIAAARTHAPVGTVVEIEVDDLDQFDLALAARPDIILIDNLPSDRIEDAVRRRDQRAPQILLEASGGVNLSTVAQIARTGVDRISVGALTHSAPALDLALDLQISPDRLPSPRDQHSV